MYGGFIEKKIKKFKMNENLMGKLFFLKIKSFIYFEKDIYVVFYRYFDIIMIFKLYVE